VKTLYDLTRQARNNDPEAIRAILHLFEPKIKKSSRLIPHGNRDDVEQEIKEEIVKAIRRFDTSTTPGFWEFLEIVK
jgi:predicted metal-dependent TIM-barrel fold hydrolase